MKKRIAIVGSILVVAALAAVPFVYAEPGFRGHMRGHAGGAGLGFFGGRHLDRLAEKLNLSEQQVDQIKAIYAALHDQNAEYRQSMRGGMMDVTETLLKNPNDVAAAQASGGGWRGARPDWRSIASKNVCNPNASSSSARRLGTPGRSTSWCPFMRSESSRLRGASCAARMTPRSWRRRRS